MVIPAALSAAVLIAAVGFAVVMAFAPDRPVTAGSFVRAGYACWLILTLGLAVYGVNLILTEKPVPPWLLGFALGALFSTLVPVKRKGGR